MCAKLGQNQLLAHRPPATQGIIEAGVTGFLGEAPTVRAARAALEHPGRGTGMSRSRQDFWRGGPRSG